MYESALKILFKKARTFVYFKVISCFV